MIKNFPQIFNMFKQIYLNKNQWRQCRIQFLEENQRIKGEVLQKNMNINQYFFPWSHKNKEKGDVVRKKKSSEEKIKNIEDLRISENNIVGYMEKKEKLFEKLNKFPFDFKAKKSLFYFPKEKILKDKKQKEQDYLMGRRMSEENNGNTKGKSYFEQRSASKPNIGNNSSLMENFNKSNWKKSQKYVNTMRPSTNKRMKEMVIKRGVLGNKSENIERVIKDEKQRFEEEDPYNIRDEKKKVWKDLKKILKKGYF